MLADEQRLWRALEFRDPRWDRRGDLTGRAVRLIADGVVDREGIPGLSQRLSSSQRDVHRELVAELGVGARKLARAQRVQTARLLLEATSEPVGQVAMAAGFRSVRQFNGTMREVFAMTPSALRARAHHAHALRARAPRAAQTDSPERIDLRLPYRRPFDGEGAIEFLARRAVPGVEEVFEHGYRRSLRLPHGSGVVELRLTRGENHLRATYWLQDLRDLAPAVQRSRALLDLDADSEAVVEALGADHLLGPLVNAVPGRRVLGHVDGDELAVRAVLGQQVSLAGASTLARWLVIDHGDPLERPVAGVTHLFPTARALAELDPARLAMPGSRRRAVIAVCEALARGELVLDQGSDRETARRQLLALPGIGAWTAGYIAIRALRDPDAFIATDLGVRHALERLGCDGRPGNAERLAESWRPYRAYALAYLWASLAPAAAASAA